jgi:aldehyde dehydrogenase (NAD+)
VWDYSPAPESQDHIRLAPRYDLFIDGAFRKPSGRSYVDSENPATLEKLAGVALAGPKDTDRAVGAARTAYEKRWSKLPARERGKYIFRIARMIQERARELSVIETLDTGKPIRESRDFDIPAAAAHFFYYAGWADKLNYAFPDRSPRPLGVVAQIIPWNFPLLMAARKIAPALATGNTVVLKPAETSSLTALKLAEIIRDCDLPPGVVNIITGTSDTADRLARHAGVDKLAFTGSTAQGKQLQETLAGTGKKLSLELGGKSAHIVLEDAALNQAVEGVISGIFFNQGQMHAAGSRLFVQESIALEFVRRLKARMRKLRVGDPLDKNTDIGTLHSRRQLEEINRFLEAGRREGLEIFQPEGPLPEKGYFCQPALFMNVAQSSRVFREEIFGPVLAMQTFRTLDEVVEKANAIPYGLSAGVWTEKGSRMLNLAARIRAGVVWANTYNKFDPASPFGGYKESGFGRDGGLHGLLPYLRL